MPCEWLRMPDGSVAHLNVGRAGGSSRVCKFCKRRYREGKLCDFPIGNGKTCDAEMCDACTRTLGRQQTPIGGGMYRLNDTIDVCPIHRDQAIVKVGQFAEPPVEQLSLFGGK